MDSGTIRLVLLFCFGLLLGQPGGLWAQCGNSASFTGALKTTSTAGCVPLRVEARSDLIGVQNVRYVYEYDGRRETPISALSAHTYTKPGEYTLLQLSEKEGLSLRACTTILVYDTLPPRVELSACGTRASLTVTDPLAFPMQYDYFLIRWGDGQTDTLRAGQSKLNHVFAGTASRPIRVQGIHRYGNCGGTTQLSFTPNQPPTISSIEQIGPQSVQVIIQNPAGLALTVQQRAGNGPFQTGPTVPAGASPTVEMPADTGLTCYRLLPGSSCPGQVPSPEVCHRIEAPPSVSASDGAYVFPDAFSPNNDGLNDVFGPSGALRSGTYRLTIFDRWGQVVFVADDPSRTWDGYVGGQMAPAGIYAYRLDTRLSSGQIHQKSGRLQLVR